MADLIGYVQTHSHLNKSLLDTYEQTEVNLADAVTKKHSHENKSVLDLVTAPFTLANETYLETTIPDALLKSYAQIYVASEVGVSQSVPNGTDWTKILLFDTNDVYNLSTPDHVNDRIVVGKTGLYKIGWSFTTQANANNFTMHTGLFKNGSRIVNARVIRKFGTAGDISTGTMATLVRCNLNDILELKCFHNYGSPVNFTVGYANFYCDKLAD